MTSLKSTNRRVGSLFAVAALVLATITPGLVPAFASAAQVTERSVQLSNSSKDMDDVNYTVEFTAPGAGAIATVLQFCNDTPLIGNECTAPAGFSAASATATGYTITQTTEAVANTIIATGTSTGSVSIPLEGVDNPANAGALYVRIVTYSNGASALAYTDTDLGDDVVDQGSAAVSITDTVGVSGAVLETMTFCVSGAAITLDNCQVEGEDEEPTSVLAAPTLKLGEPTGNGVIALDAAHLSTGDIFTQLSTNAAGGAVVNLKSGNNCGGLMRSGESTCEIAAANTSTGNAALGQARVGVTVNPTGDTSGAFGTLAIAGGGSPFYHISDFKLNYVSGGASGVTSPFGDPILNTAGPLGNKNATVSFGASISPQTPAGLYANDYSLIATGKY